MRILLIHSYYRQKGGEDVVFEQDLELIKKFEEVRALSFNNRAGMHGGIQFFLSIWNSRITRKLIKEIKEFKPDLVHIYNWHYATGPNIIRTASRLGCKVVLSVGNYRLLCPSGTLSHNGKLFLDSISKPYFPWKAVFMRVYRESYLQTFWLSFIVWFHKKIGTWDRIDRFIVPSRVVKELYTKTRNYINLPAEKFVVKPNFSMPYEKNSPTRNNHFLYVGRLSEEKGITNLLDAFSESPYEVMIAGTGPLWKTVSEVSKRFPNIRYVGVLDKESVLNALSICTALVVPSICYETFGMVVTEGLSCGCPIIASDIGSPSEIVQEGVTGFLFKAGDKQSLCNALDRWQKLSEHEKKDIQENCRSNYQNMYSPEKNWDQLLSIYESVMNK